MQAFESRKGQAEFSRARDGWSIGLVFLKETKNVKIKKEKQLLGRAVKEKDSLKKRSTVRHEVNIENVFLESVIHVTYHHH